MKGILRLNGLFQGVLFKNFQSKLLVAGIGV